MKLPQKKRNPLAKILWSPQYRKTIENSSVYQRHSKHKNKSGELVLLSKSVLDN